MLRAAGFTILLALAAWPLASAAEKPMPRQPYRIAPVDLAQQVIWGASCAAPDGSLLSFGGQDQAADDGIAHTRFRERGGPWLDLAAPLAEADPLGEAARGLRTAQATCKAASALVRRCYFDDETVPLLRSFDRQKRQMDTQLADVVVQIGRLMQQLPNEAVTQQRGRRATDLLSLAIDKSRFVGTSRPITAPILSNIQYVERKLQQAADVLSAEPPGRALSPIVHEPRSGLFVLFGGDHCDYLTCDTWVFDPQGRHWQPRGVAFAPPPRAGHEWRAIGNGKLALRGGYTYTSSTDYCGTQYAAWDDGEWIYDVEANKWTGADDDQLTQSTERTYRTGPFDPQFFWQGPPPDAAAFATFLTNLPKNTWTQTEPPRLPQLNRDWGTAVYDAEHDVILRFAGGHSAHGGTDVLHYHCRTNRWELCFPVEFPLGQLYSNTSYPAGRNFNGRPWVTGHTYQSYAFDDRAKRLLFTGERSHTYFYDPEIGDWVGRNVKPPGMNYDSCFFTLTLCATPNGLVCWNKGGQLFRYATDSNRWVELELHGAKLPGAEVDNSTLLYDGRRERLLFVRKPYGDPPFDGVLHALDLKTLEVSKLEPAGSPAASRIGYLCQLRYDSDHDLVLCGCTFKDAAGTRRTPAYDCQGNRWVSLAIGGDDPSGERGRNVSLGLMYDARRSLFWAVDAGSRIYVLRLDPQSADVQALK